MNFSDLNAIIDQLRRNLTPLKQIVFTVTSVGVITIHKQFGWGTPLDSNDIVLTGGTVTVTSRGLEFLSSGLFVQVNTNAPYVWVDAGSLTITAIFGIANKMSVKIVGEF